MSDILSGWQVDKRCADGLPDYGDVLSGGDVQSAIIISLFTDKLARTDDDIDDAYRRGWWGDLGSDYQIGSRLWLLKRQKLTLKVAKQAEDYARGALQWLIDDGVISHIEIITQIIYPNRLNMIIRYPRFDDECDLRFFWSWEA